MSPGAIRQLIEVYALPNAERNEILCDDLAALGLVRRDGDGYSVTERGEVYVRMLTTTPLPEWRDPRPFFSGLQSVGTEGPSRADIAGTYTNLSVHSVAHD
jgi:hypothetical protein